MDGWGEGRWQTREEGTRERVTERKGEEKTTGKKGGLRCTKITNFY